jgi:DNA-binding response OmpR family regulator
VRAILRRMEKSASQGGASEGGAWKGGSSKSLLRAGDLTLDRAGHMLKVCGQPIDLTPSEFELLATLMAAPGRVFSRLELLERLQGAAYEGYERTIDVHIRNLRAKIEPEPASPRYVETVYGAGYRFTARE